MSLKLEESQLSYLEKRGNEYDRKYGMFKHLIEKIDHVESVVELFGGTGIETEYIKKYLSPSIHVVCEQNLECCKALENKDILLIKGNCFDYSYPGNIDLLVVDSVFNKKEFDKITNLIGKFSFKYLILTNTGVFHVKFEKWNTYENYWTSLIDQICTKLDISHLKTVYDYDFGMMLFAKNEDTTYDFEKNTYKDTLWRDIRADTLNYIKNSSIITIGE